MAIMWTHASSINSSSTAANDSSMCKSGAAPPATAMEVVTEPSALPAVVAVASNPHKRPAARHMSHSQALMLHQRTRLSNHHLRVLTLPPKLVPAPTVFMLTNRSSQSRRHQRASHRRHTMMMGLPLLSHRAPGSATAAQQQQQQRRHRRPAPQQPRGDAGAPTGVQHLQRAAASQDGLCAKDHVAVMALSRQC